MSRADHPDDPFTLNELAHAMRGILRQVPIYVQTDQGLKPVLLVTATHVSAAGDLAPGLWGGMRSSCRRRRSRVASGRPWPRQTNSPFNLVRPVTPPLRNTFCEVVDTFSKLSNTFSSA